MSKGVRVATLEEVYYYGGHLPKGLYPPMVGSAGPTLLNHIASTQTSSTTESTNGVINTTGATVLVLAGTAYSQWPLTISETGLAGGAQNTWTFPLSDPAAPGKPYSSSGLFAWVAICENPLTSTTHGVTVSGTDYPGFSFMAFAGTGTLDVNTGIDAPGTGVGATGTPSQNGEVLISVSTGYYSATVPTGWTAIDGQSLDGGINYGWGVAMLSQTTATSVEPVWVWDTAHNADALISFTATPVPAQPLIYQSLPLPPSLGPAQPFSIGRFNFTPQSIITASSLAQVIQGARFTSELGTNLSAPSTLVLGAIVQPGIDNSLSFDLVTSAVSGGGSVTAGDTSLSSEAVLRVISLSRAITDISLSTDAVTRTPVLLARVVTDASSSGDTTSRNQPVIRFTNDTSASGDAATRTWIISRTNTDISSTTDIASRYIPGSNTASDTSQSSDVVTLGGLVIARTTADVSATFDTANRTWIPNRSTSDASVSADAVARYVVVSRTSVDTSISTDSSRRVIDFNRTTTDTSISTDFANRAPVLRSRVGSETSTSADLTQAAHVITRTTSDVTTSADIASPGTRSVGRTAIDTSASADIATRAKHTAYITTRYGAELGAPYTQLSSIALATANTSIPDISVSADHVFAAQTHTYEAADASSSADSVKHTIYGHFVASDISLSSDHANRSIVLDRTAVNASASTDSAKRVPAGTEITADSSSSIDVATRLLRVARTTARYGSQLAVITTQPSAIALGSEGAIRDVSLSADAVHAAIVHTFTATNTSLSSDQASRVTPWARTDADISDSADVAVSTRVKADTAADVSSTADLALRAQFATRGLHDTSVTVDRSGPPLLTSDVSLSADSVTGVLRALALISFDVALTTDVAIRHFARSRGLNDVSLTLDAATSVHAFNRMVSDLSATVDSVFVVNPYLRTVGDTSVTSDAARRATVAQLRQATDVDLSSDAVLRSIGSSRQGIDISLGIDSVGFVHPLYRIAFDTSTTADITTVLHPINRQGYDASISYDIVHEYVASATSAYDVSLTSDSSLFHYYGRDVSLSEDYIAYYAHHEFPTTNYGVAYTPQLMSVFTLNDELTMHATRPTIAVIAQEADVTLV